MNKASVMFYYTVLSDFVKVDWAHTPQESEADVCKEECEWCREPITGFQPALDSPCGKILSIAVTMKGLGGGIDEKKTTRTYNHGLPWCLEQDKGNDCHLTEEDRSHVYVPQGIFRQCVRAQGDDRWGGTFGWRGGRIVLLEIVHS